MQNRFLTFWNKHGQQLKNREDRYPQITSRILRLGYDFPFQSGFHCNGLLGVRAYFIKLFEPEQIQRAGEFHS